MGWWGAYIETSFSKVENYLFEKEEGRFGSEVSFNNEQSPSL